MLDDNLDPTRRDEHGFTSKGYADKSANRISAAKSAARLPSAAEPVAPRRPTRSLPRIELSLTQILGSTSAAVTAAFLGSRLGVAGTLIGAALASVISVVGGAIYTSSIKATRRRMARVIVAVRSPDEDGVARPAAVRPAHSRPLMPLTPPGPRQLPNHRPPGNPGRTPNRPRRPMLRGIAVGALLSAAVFTGAVAVVTGYETVSGEALSGGQAGGLTILGGTGVDPGSSGNPRPSTDPGNTGTGATGTPAGSDVATTAGATPGSGTSPSSGTGSSAPAPAPPAGTGPITTGTDSRATTSTSPLITGAPSKTPATSVPAEPPAPTTGPAAPTTGPADGTSSAGSTTNPTSDGSNSSGSATDPVSTPTTPVTAPPGAGVPR